LKKPDTNNPHYSLLYPILAGLFGLTIVLLSLGVTLAHTRQTISISTLFQIFLSEPLVILNCIATITTTTMAALFGWRLDHLIKANRLLNQSTNQLTVDLENSKRIEIIIAQGKKEWEITFDAITDMILTTDQNGMIQRCNQATIQRLGTTYPELISKSIDLVLFASETPAQSLLSTTEKYIRFPTIKGWFGLARFTIQREDGSQGFTFVFRDLTEQLRIEAEIRRQKQYFEALVNNNPVATLLLDLNLRIVSFNPAFENLFGYTIKEVLGKNIDSLIVPDYDSVLAGEYTSQLQSGQLIHAFGKRKRKDGSLVHVEISAVPVKVAGKLTGYLILYHDVTELVLAREQAVAADRAKSEFLANMSHEIRTPLNGVLGMLDLALSTELSDEQKDFLETSHESANALLSLLNDILDFAKIESRQLDLENIDFDLRTTVEGTVASLAPRADAKNLEMACLIHHDIPIALQGDPGRLRQILVNLIGNSIKFTQHGEIVVRVVLDSEDDQVAVLRFSVSDTGIGVPKDRQASIFERFVQVDGSTTRKYGGTGLGLSISKQLAELMGGVIGLDSEAGQGSTFWFTARFTKSPGSIPYSEFNPIDLADLHILAVDDNNTNRTVILKTLENVGCRVTTSPGGKDALQILLSAHQLGDPFQLVLLDMQMPEMDGEQTLIAIKAEPAFSALPVIMLTSMGQRGDVSHLEALGCAGYLLKPIQQIQLYESISAVMSQTKSLKNEKPVIFTRHVLNENRSSSTRILLAEDNPINQKVAVKLLQKINYSVDVVENGRQAVEAVQKQKYSAVFMDVQMPEMDGFEATRLIREQEAGTRHIPIVAMTAHAMKGDRERCLEAGMDDYLPKPIDPQELHAMLDKWIPSPTKPESQPLSSPGNPVPVAESSPIDLEKALVHFGNDARFFDEMFQEFVEDLPKRFQEIQSAYMAGNTSDLHRLSHSLKGAASTFEAEPLTTYAHRMELQAKSGDLSNVQDLLNEIRKEVHRLQNFRVHAPEAGREDA
jgi:two-component system sensor histidine kinase/response regulator